MLELRRTVLWLTLMSYLAKLGWVLLWQTHGTFKKMPFHQRHLPNLPFCNVM